MTPCSPERIAVIVGDLALAEALLQSMTVAVRSPRVSLPVDGDAWALFEQSLDAAIRDIDRHPRGRLFRRLIEFGPRNPDEPESITSDGSTVLSDPECGACVEFIYSHMVNRFKGELAELLAVEPCLDLVEDLVGEGRLPPGVRLYWGDVVRQRRRVRGSEGDRWGGFVKGADGLLAEVTAASSGAGDHVTVHGLVEVKSMRQSTKRIVGQLGRHAIRLGGGVMLGDRVFGTDQSTQALVRIIVQPSAWRLSRDWESVATDKGRKLVVRRTDTAPPPNQTEQIGNGLWKMKLAWSEETLAQAAYDMTFWYMSQVGGYVYADRMLPDAWRAMTSEEAGYNAIKMMLYYILLRPISERQARIATRLYNVYCFGYPLGADSRQMLWPEDFPD